MDRHAGRCAGRAGAGVHRAHAATRRGRRSTTSVSWVGSAPSNSDSPVLDRGSDSRRRTVRPGLRPAGVPRQPGCRSARGAPHGRGRRRAALAVSWRGAVGGRRLGRLVVLRHRAQPAEALPGSTLAYVEHRPRPERRAEDRGAADPEEVPGVRGRGRPRHRRRHPEVDLRRDPGVEAPATDLDYADDIEPWLGDRFAVAAVDAGGDEPGPGLRGPGEGRGRRRRRAGEAVATAPATDRRGRLGHRRTAGRWSRETQEIVGPGRPTTPRTSSLADDDDFTALDRRGRRRRAS